MKILVVSDIFTNGGLETQIKTYYDSLPQGVEMVFAFSQYTGQVDLRDAKIYTGFDFSGMATVENFCKSVERLAQIIREEEIDAIHAHPFYGFFSALFASQITGVPLTYSFHGLLSFSFCDTPVSAAIFRYALEIGAVAQVHSVSSIGMEAFEKIGYKNVRFMPNPVGGHFEKAKIANNKKWALVSRLDSDKLPEIKLFLASIDEYGIDKVDVFGTGANEQELKAFVEDKGLSQRVAFMGFSNHLSEQLRENYNGVVGIGRVVIEALAMGLPVFFIGYGKLTGYINKELYEKIKYENFSNYRISDTNYAFPSLEEIEQIRQDVKKNLSISVLSEKYVSSIRDSKSVFSANLKTLYNEYKKLSESEDGKNASFLFDRRAYNLVNQNISRFSVDSTVNGVFISANHVFGAMDVFSSRENELRLANEEQNRQIAFQAEQIAQLTACCNSLEARLESQSAIMNKGFVDLTNRVDYLERTSLSARTRLFLGRVKRRIFGRKR